MADFYPPKTSLYKVKQKIQTILLDSNIIQHFFYYFLNVHVYILIIILNFFLIKYASSTIMLEAYQRIKNPKYIFLIINRFNRIHPRGTNCWNNPEKDTCEDRNQC